MIIATRRLALAEDGKRIEFDVTLHAPELDGECWACAYSVAWPDGTVVGRGYGHDAVQAISLTLQRIGVDLYMSDHHRAGRLVWERPGGGYGFPLPPNASDLLVGDDARFLKG